MRIRAKFMLTQIKESHFSKSHPPSYDFFFQPQYDLSIPEDRRFSLATPTGEVHLHVDNPDAVAYWKEHLGENFYLDFLLAEDAQP